MTNRNGTRSIVGASALVCAGLAAVTLAAPAGATTTAQFTKGQAVLNVFGDSTDNAIVVSRDHAGDILINGGDVDVHGAAATVDNVGRLHIATGGGNDTVSFDETNGALPPADVFGGSGNDRISGSSAPDPLFGEAGDDVLIGGRGNELLDGGDGNDFVDGNQGADTAELGDGNDTFQWDPGDGSDVVDGGSGHDVMLFNGAPGAERFDVTANGDRVRFTRDIGTITMDLGSVEQIDTRALGGADTFSAGDLTGTGVSDLEIDEGVAGAADGAADRVTVNGTGGPDVINVSGTLADGVTVTGLAARVHITGTDPADALDIEAASGDDAVTAGQLAAGLVSFSADGGEGNDLIVGSAGDDVLHGGPGDDTLDGGPGTDVLDGGPGANLLIQ
jgi:Ca2+-binding RTX toxin-like protein